MAEKTTSESVAWPLPHAPRQLAIMLRGIPPLSEAPPWAWCAADTSLSLLPGVRLGQLTTSTRLRDCLFVIARGVSPEAIPVVEQRGVAKRPQPSQFEAG